MDTVNGGTGSSLPLTRTRETTYLNSWVNLIRSLLHGSWKHFMQLLVSTPCVCLHWLHFITNFTSASNTAWMTNAITKLTCYVQANPIRVSIQTDQMSDISIDLDQVVYKFSLIDARFSSQRLTFNSKPMNIFHRDNSAQSLIHHL